MLRYLSLAALALALGTGGTARAQTLSGQDDVKKLEAELQKLQEQVKAVEAKLKEARAAVEKKEARRPGPPFGAFGPFGGRGGFGRMDPERMKEMRERFERMRKDGERAGPPWGFGRRGAAPERKPQEEAKPSDVEKRLDKILKEVEELRQELKKK